MCSRSETQVRFVPDSALEGDGFEPSVPGTKEPVFVAEGELRDRTGAAKKGCFLCGTDGSNPSPSSGESGKIHARACGEEGLGSLLASGYSPVYPCHVRPADMR